MMSPALSLLLLVSTSFVTWCSAQDSEPANYGRSCTPTSNPFLDNEPPSMSHPPPDGCGACLYLSTCTLYGGRTAGSSTGCEQFDSEQIGCCTHQRKNYNGCLMDPKEPVYTKVEKTMPLSGSQKADFIAGSVVFTKASLLDSPSRYWSLVSDALDEVALIPFTPQEKEDTFYKVKLECPNRGATPDGDPFREFGINPNKSSVAILGGTDPTNGGLLINAWFDVKVRCRYSVSIGYCPVSFLCFERCRLKDSIVLLKYSNKVPITVNVTFDAASSLLVVKPKVDLKLTWDNFEYSCGDDLVSYVSPLIGFFTGMNLQDRITSTVENSFKDVVSRDLLLPQEYRASEEILVGYRLTNLTFFDDSHILLTVAMNLSAVYPDGTRRYYEFPKKFHDLVPPSPDFSLLLQDKDTTPLLNGMRVSADFLTAMAGVTAMIYATVSNTTKISDANITYNMSIAGPELTIPESNSVEAVFPFGRLFAVCGSEPDVGKELVNVNFDDVRGRVGIEYVSGDPTIGLRPGIIIQYQSINITGTRIIIKAPPFPLEGDVLQNAVSNSLANRQTYINDILRENPVQLPPMLLPYFPHPRLQATSVANAGGYFELLTSCSCSAPPPTLTNAEQSAMGTTACRAKSCGECVRSYPRCGWCDPLATGLNSTLSLTGKCEEGIMCSGGLVKPLTDTKLCPPLSGGYDDGCRFKCAELRIKRTRAAADAERKRAAEAAAAAAAPPVRELRRTDAQSPRAEDAVAAMAKRAAAPYLVTVYSSPNCSMARAGTQMNAVVLAPTDGRCERSQGVFGLSNDALGPFYSITVNGPNNITALMMCNKNCTNCAASLNGEATNLCKVGKEGTLSWVLQENAGSCFGGIGSADSVGLMGIYLFSGDERCTDATRMPLPLQDDNDTSPVTVVGLGVRSRAAELKMCQNLNKNDVLRSSFAKISLSDASVASLQMACKSGCINCGLEVADEFALRQCYTPPNLKKAAIDNEQPDAIPSLYVTDLRTCTFTPPVDVKAMNMSMNMTLNTPKPTVDPLGDTNSATIGIAVSVAVVVAIAIVWGIIRCPAHSGVVDAGHGSMLAGFKAYLKRHSWTFGRPTPGFVWLFVFNIFAIVLAFIELMVWTIGRAIELIDANFLSSTLNINVKYDSYVNTGELSGRFAVWLESGNVLMSVVIVIMILLLIDNMITRHHNHDAPNKPKRRNLFGLRMRKSVWFIVLAAHVAMLLVLPLQSTFGVTTSVEFDAQGNETLGKAKGTIETALGYATGLYMFNVVLSLFTNLLQLIPAGIMCGTVLYLADKGESIPNTRGAVVGRGVWVTAALVNITAHLIIPVALSAAVLIYLHRRGMAESFWVGLVWLVQWIAGLLLCALVFFRRVVPAPDRRGHVLVQSHIYFYAYLVVMVVTTLIEVFHMVASASEVNFNVFLVLYRVTTFLIVTCFTRVWLQAYRPKYSRAALKERREKEHVDAAVADLELAGEAPEPSKAERMLAPVSAFCGKFGAYALLPVMGPVYIVSYLIEVGRPATDSLPRRRTWFFVGVIFFCVVLMDTFVHLVSSTPKDDAKESFSHYEDQLYGIKWPDDDAGGDLFDPAFNLYATLRWTKFAIVFLCAILLIGLLIDDFRASRVSQDATQRSVWRAQQAGYVIITALYVAALTPAVPDYPSAANLRSILPECGYSFNHLVQNVYGGITGFVLTLFIINAIVPVLGIVMPSLSRTCKMIIGGVLHANDGSGGHDDHSHGNCCSKMVHWHPEDGPAPPAVIDHAHMLFQMSMVLSPLLIGIALLLVFVFYGNSFTLIMILVNFIGPIITAFALSPFSIGSSYLIAVWFFYFPSLMAIFIEIGIRFDYLTLASVLEAVSKGSFWMSVIFVCAEVCIANVIVADIVYLLIWSLYPEYSVLADQLPTPFMTMGGNTIALNSIDMHSTNNSSGGTVRGVPTLQSAPSVAQFQTMNTMHGGATMKFAPMSRASEQIRELDDEFGGQRYGTKAPSDAPFLTNSDSTASVGGTHGQLRSQPSTPSLGNSAATQIIDNPGGMFSCHICGNSYPSANDVFIHRAKRHPEVAHLTPPGANSGGTISPKNLY